MESRRGSGRTPQDAGIGRRHRRVPEDHSFGSLHLEPSYLFDRAQISGVPAEEPFPADIERAEGGFMTSSTVIATGEMGGKAFHLFGTQNGTLDHAIIRGRYGDDSVSLDLRVHERRADRMRTLRGESTAPPAFSVLAAAALAYFG